MKSFLMSILLVVACVCVSCEPTVIDGEIDKVKLSKSDKEKLDAIFQYVKETQAYGILQQLDPEYRYLAGFPFVVKSEQELRKLAPADMELPKIDFTNHSLVWCIFRSGTSQTDIKSFRLLVKEKGEATVIVRHRTTSADCAIGTHCPYAVFDIPSSAIEDISADVKSIR